MSASFAWKLPWSWEGRAGLGVGRTEKHSWVLVFGRNPTRHPPRPQAGCTWACSPVFCGCCSPPAVRFPSHSHWGVGLVQVHPHGARVQSDTHLFLGDAQAQLASSRNPDLSTSEPCSFSYSLHHDGSQKERGRKQERAHPSIFLAPFPRVCSQEGQLRGRTSNSGDPPSGEAAVLISPILHVFRKTLQIPSWLIARNPVLSSNANSLLHSGTVKVPSFSLFLHFDFSRCALSDK